MFETDKVYTFEFYEDKFAASKYVLDLGFTTIGLKSILDGQPLQRLGKMRDGRYLWVSHIVSANLNILCMLCLIDLLLSL